MTYRKAVARILIVWFIIIISDNFLFPHIPVNPIFANAFFFTCFFPFFKPFFDMCLVFVVVVVAFVLFFYLPTSFYRLCTGGKGWHQFPFVIIAPLCYEISGIKMSVPPLLLMYPNVTFGISTFYHCHIVLSTINSLMIYPEIS